MVLWSVLTENMKSFKKYKPKSNYFKKNKIYLWLISVLLIVLSAYLIVNSLKFKYEITDYFAQDGKFQKLVFIFVKVNYLDKNKIIENSKNIYEAKIENNKYDRTAVIIYFFRQKDLEAIPKGKEIGLQKKFKSPNVENNLRYVKKGYIYMNFFSKSRPESNYDTIFTSELFVPKKGLRAKKVMSARKR